jgi:hypothetical protein
MKKLIYTLLFLASAHVSFAAVSFIDVDDLATWEKMIALAKAQKRSLFVQYVPMPCSECKELKRNTFKDKALSAEIAENYIALKVLSFSEVGKALNGLFDLTEAAALLVLNTNEVLFYKYTGFISAEDLLPNLKEIDKQIANYPNWQRGGANGDLEKIDWLSFLLIEQQNGRVNPSSPIVRDVSSLLDSSDFEKPVTQKFTSLLGIDIDNPIFQTLKRNPELLKENDYFSWDVYFQTVFDYNIFRAIALEDSVFLEDVLFQLKQLPNDSIVPNIDLKGRQIYLAELSKWSSYDTITLIYLNEFEPDSANMYQQEAMFLMENYQQSKPQDLALKYLKLGLQKKETFELYYTLGLFLFNTNDLPNAYKATRRAYDMSSNEAEAELSGRLLSIIETYY